MLQDIPVEAEINEVLQADDLLNRVYIRGNAGASLFVAAFKSQRTGKTPHSPKNCLPGAGWLPLSSGTVEMDVARAQKIKVNRYVIARGESRSLVLYWYQSRDRVVADEFEAKFWVMVDAMRLNRTDTALVRVVVPIPGKDEAAAEQAGADFVKSVYGTLLEYLPS
jgi:EpsI family protein